MNYSKPLFILITLFTPLFVTPMDSNKECTQGFHNYFIYDEIIPHLDNETPDVIRSYVIQKKCEHIIDCPYCCPQMKMRQVTQCQNCPKYGTSGGQPKEIIRQQTPQEEMLIRACAENNIGAIQSLLSQGVNPNTRRFTGVRTYDYDGKTPLMYTTEPTIVDILLVAGADPNIVSLSGNGPLSKFCSEETPTNIAIVQKLLAAKANPDMHHHDKFTPLIISLNNNAKEIAEILLKAGANPNHQEPLHVISDPNMRNLLKKFGAIEKKSNL